MIQLRIIEGRNPVIEALRGDAQIDTILINKEAAQGSLNKIFELAKEKNILIKNVDKALLDRLSENKRHQGVIAEAMEYEYKEIDDLLNYAKEKNIDLKLALSLPSKVAPLTTAYHMKETIYNILEEL